MTTTTALAVRGERVMLARMRAKLNQEQAASLIGLSRKTFIDIEAGRRDLWMSEVEMLALGLNVNPAYLRGETDNFSTYADRDMGPFVNLELPFDNEELALFPAA